MSEKPIRSFCHRAFGLGSVVLAATVSLGLAGPASADQLSVSQFGSITATLPWAVAQEKGLFEEAGIQIDEIIAGAGGGTTLRNMLASDLPYGEVAMSAALAAIRSGVDLVVVNVASDHIGEIVLATMPDSDVNTVEDLEGRKAGFTNPKSTSEILLRIVLERAGMSGKVDLVATGGFGPGLTALGSGGIDAAPLTDPILSLEPERYKTIFAFGDFVPRITWLVGVATKEFAENEPEKLRSLIAVRRKAVDFIYDNPEEAAQIYAKYWERDPAEVAKFFPGYFEITDLWSRGDFNQDGLDAMSDGLLLVEEITEPVDWKATVDQQYLPEDLPRAW